MEPIKMHERDDFLIVNEQKNLENTISKLEYFMLNQPILSKKLGHHMNEWKDVSIDGTGVYAIESICSKCSRDIYITVFLDSVYSNGTALLSKCPSTMLILPDN